MRKLFFVVIGLLVICSYLVATDIPMFRGNAEHTGVVADSPMPKSGYETQKWKFHTGGKIRSSAALVDGVLYFGSDDGYLYALKATDGSVVWKLKTDGAVQSSPAVANGMVYFISKDGVFRAVEAKSGQVK